MNGTQDPSSTPPMRAFRYRRPESAAPDGACGGFGPSADIRNKGAEPKPKRDGQYQNGQTVLDRQVLRRILSKVVVKAALKLKRR